MEGNAFPPIVGPSAAGIMIHLVPTTLPAAELLVPRSIPIIFPTSRNLFYFNTTSVR
jgi:hypothetical protein